MSYYCYLICDFASCLLVPQKSFNALESDEPACVAFHVLNEGPNVFIHKNYVFNNGSFRIEGKRMAWGGVEHTNRLPFLLGAIRNSGLFPPP